MTKQKHKQLHRHLHKALVFLIEDWQACAPDFAPRMTEKRSVRSLLEWSERQIHVPEEHVPVRVIPTTKKRHNAFAFVFKSQRHIPIVVEREKTTKQ
jgi:riboflavin biosynthesis pyrimidine reductase